MAGIASRVRKGSVWIAGSSTLVSIFGLLSTFILARLLTPEDFGLVAIGTALLLIVNSISELSLTNALIYHEKPERQQLDSAWTLNFIRGLLIAIFFVVVGPFIAAFYDDDRLVLITAIIGLSALVEGLRNPRLAMLLRDLKFWQHFVVQVTSKIAMVATSITIAIVYTSYFALVGGIVAGAIAGVIISYIFVPYRPRFQLSKAREFLSFSGWLSLDQIVKTLNWRLDPLIVGRMLGPTELGLFTLASTLSDLPTKQTTRPLIASLFPALRQIHDEPTRLRQAYLRAQSVMTAVALPCAVIMAGLADPIVRLALGEQWEEAAPLVQVLAVLAAIHTIGSPSRALAMATGHTKLIFYRSSQALLYRLPLTITFLAVDGLRGLLVARVLIVIIGVMLSVNVAYKAAGVGLGAHITSNWRTLVGGAVVLLGLISAGQLSPEQTTLISSFLIVAFGSVLAMAVYLGIIFCLWQLTGRPTGPETEFIEVSKKLLARYVHKSTSEEAKDG